MRTKDARNIRYGIEFARWEIKINGNNRAILLAMAHHLLFINNELGSRAYDRLIFRHLEKVESERHLTKMQTIKHKINGDMDGE